MKNNSLILRILSILPVMVRRRLPLSIRLSVMDARLSGRKTDGVVFAAQIQGYDPGKNIAGADDGFNPERLLSDEAIRMADDATPPFDEGPFEAHCETIIDGRYVVSSKFGFFRNPAEAFSFLHVLRMIDVSDEGPVFNMHGALLERSVILSGAIDSPSKRRISGKELAMAMAESNSLISVMARGKIIDAYGRELAIPANRLAG
jgi:hypothetical protein